MNEFELIARYFKQQATERADVNVGIGDDAAVVTVPRGYNLTMSIDTMVAGVHFPVDTAAADLGHKALAVSLSDMAAMGAEPTWLTLSITMPDPNSGWLAEFSRGLLQLCERYAVQLVGGDTCRGPLSLTTQVQGLVPCEKALLRSGANVGDLIYVSGELGGAGLALQDKLYDDCQLSDSDRNDLMQRLSRPEPRVELGMALRNLATAAIDISDGLLADLGHIAQASELGARIELTQVPKAAVLTDYLALDAAYRLALAAGDDYELCFTVPPAAQSGLQELSQRLALPLTCVGEMVTGHGVKVMQDDATEFVMEKQGYAHF